FQNVARSVAQYQPETAFGTVSVITLLLFVGATGKSAQIPLYVWLPDAMEGPTPVSALIHAATMVTAGVYMIGRNAVLFSHAPQTLTIVAIVGVVTALMAGTIGLVQNDIKRVLAYSTVSQLGYMFLAMGVGAYAAGHTRLWMVGLLTSLLTAIYMFRLVFLAFHGDRTSDQGGHSSHLHDAPPAMAMVLIALAVGSVVAGYAGLGARFEHFLEP